MLTLNVSKQHQSALEIENNMVHITENINKHHRFESATSYVKKKQVTNWERENLLQEKKKKNTLQSSFGGYF
jgi:hypothetical protein